jgi:hypothetical protein
MAGVISAAARCAHVSGPQEVLLSNAPGNKGDGGGKGDGKGLLHVVAPRCYCLLSRLPALSAHFALLEAVLWHERSSAQRACVTQLAKLPPRPAGSGGEGGGRALGLQVSGCFHIVCGRFDWYLPICCVFLS